MGLSDQLNQAKLRLSYADVIHGRQQFKFKYKTPLNTNPKREGRDGPVNSLPSRPEKPSLVPVVTHERVLGEPLSYVKALFEAHRKNNGANVLSTALSVSPVVPDSDTQAGHPINTVAAARSEETPRSPWQKTLALRPAEGTACDLKAEPGAGLWPTPAETIKYSEHDQNKFSATLANKKRHMPILINETRNMALSPKKDPLATLTEKLDMGDDTSCTKQKTTQPTSIDEGSELHQRNLSPPKLQQSETQELLSSITENPSPHDPSLHPKKMKKSNHKKAENIANVSTYLAKTPNLDRPSPATSPFLYGPRNGELIPDSA